MALIECLECKKQVSSEANSCPHCGISIKKDTTIIVSSSPIAPTQTQLIEPGFEPAYGNIFLGILLIFLFSWLTFFFIPSHNPEILEKFLYSYPEKLVKNILNRDPAEILITIMRLYNGKLPYGCPEWVFNKEYYLYIILSAYVFLVLSIIITLSGFFYKNYKILFCKHCNSQTIARKKSLGFFCEKCNTNLQKSALPILLLLLIFFIILKLSFSVFQSQKSTTKINTSNYSKNNASISQNISWENRAEKFAREFIEKNKITIALGIQRIIHPSGNNPYLINTEFVKSYKSITAKMQVNWNSANNQYATIVAWEFSQHNHISAKVTFDNANTQIDTKIRVKLEKFFRDLYFMLSGIMQK